MREGWRNAARRRSRYRDDSILMGATFATFAAFLADAFVIDNGRSSLLLTDVRVVKVAMVVEVAHSFASTTVTIKRLAVSAARVHHCGSDRHAQRATA